MRLMSGLGFSGVVGFWGTFDDVGPEGMGREGGVGPAESDVRNVAASTLEPVRRSGMETFMVVQSIAGLVCCNQGNPRTTCDEGWSLVMRKSIGMREPEEN